MIMHPAHKDSGNIIIYLLGAIALMGILVYMVKGSSMPGASIDVERTAIKVSEVQQYGNELEKAVAFIIGNGYSDTDIRFAHPNASSAYGTITDIPDRQVFAPSGGGATWRDPSPGIQIASAPWTYTGQIAITGIGTTCSTPTKCTDLVAILPNVTKDFCIALNNKVGIINPSNSPPAESNGVHVAAIFSGAYTYMSALNVVETESKLEGCFEGNTADPALSLTDRYYYYRVLLPR